MDPRLDTLAEDVARRFAAFEPHLWPNPHPTPGEVDDAEYSRCPDPGKYVVVGQRATAWVDALVAAGLATPRTEIGRVPVLGDVRTTTLTPVCPTADEIFIHVSVHGLPAVHLSLGDPGAVALDLPDCGCDACDQGSADLIEQVDVFFCAVIQGQARIDQDAKHSAVTLGDYARSTTTPGGVDLPTGTWHGSSWW